MSKPPKTPTGKKTTGSKVTGRRAGTQSNTVASLQNLSGRAGPAVRVHTAKKRTLASTRWLQRQLNDPYVQAAKQAGFRSRAAFKLVEIDEKFKLLRPGQLVVDLGAAPGGWTQHVVKQTGSDQPNSKSQVVALDILPMDPIDGATMLVADFTTDEAVEMLMAHLGGRKAHVVLSDLSHNTTGDKSTDHWRIIHLIELAWEFAAQVLAPNGAFVCKVFQGGAGPELVKQFKTCFTSVKHFKPPASRKESPEIYLVAQGFKPNATKPSSPDNEAITP